MGTTHTVMYARSSKQSCTSSADCLTFARLPRNMSTELCSVAVAFRSVPPRMCETSPARMRSTAPAYDKKPNVTSNECQQKLAANDWGTETLAWKMEERERPSWAAEGSES